MYHLKLYIDCTSEKKGYKLNFVAFGVANFFTHNDVKAASARETIERSIIEG